MELRNGFRLLNVNERDLISNVWSKGLLAENAGDFKFNEDTMQVSYEPLPGGFLVCLIYSPASGNLYRGVSRRSKMDKPNRLKGEMIAFRRAVLNSRPVQVPKMVAMEVKTAPVLNLPQDYEGKILWQTTDGDLTYFFTTAGKWYAGDENSVWESCDARGGNKKEIFKKLGEMLLEQSKGPEITFSALMKEFDKAENEYPYCTTKHVLGIACERLGMTQGDEK